MRTRDRVLCLLLFCALGLSGCRGGGSTVVPQTANHAVDRSASAITWQDVGPIFLTGNASYPTGRSGKLQAFSMSGGSNPRLYVAGGFGRGQEIATDAGIFASADGGQTWTPVDNGLTDTVVNDVWASPNRAGVVLVATQFGGVFRSLDGGASWTNVDATPGATNFAYTGSALYVTDDTGIKVSLDAGKTWQLDDVTLAPANAIAYANGALYAGDVANNFYAFSNGKWRALAKISLAGQNMGIHAIAIDSTNTQQVYATLNAIVTHNTSTAGSQALFTSTDGGAHWQLAPVPSTFYGEQMISMGAVDPHVVYVGAEFKALWSGDGGGTWHTYRSTGDQRGLFMVDDNGVNACYTATDQGLFYFSRCGSEITLTSLTQGISNNYVTAFTVAGSTIMAALQDFTYAASTNGGGLWFKPKFTGASQLVHENGDAAINPLLPKYCYSLTARGYDFSSNGCQSFASDESFGNGGSKPSGDDIAFDPKRPGRVYMIASLNKGPAQVFVSTNAGRSMKPSGWALNSPGKIYVDPSDGNHIMISVLSGNVTRLAYTTTGAPPFKFATGLFFPSAVAVDPANPKIVLAADSSTNIYRSNDGGVSFARIPAVLPMKSLLRVDRRRNAIVGLRGDDEGASGGGQQSTALPTHIVFNKGPNPYVVLTTLHGAWLSTDTGSTWQRIDTGNATISHIFSDAQWVNGTLYLSTYGQGIIKSSAPLQ